MSARYYVGWDKEFADTWSVYDSTVADNDGPLIADCYSEQNAEMVAAALNGAEQRNVG